MELNKTAELANELFDQTHTCEECEQYNDLVIPVTDTCAHKFQVEYVHQNDTCDFSKCWVAECSDCHAFVAECGMEG